MLNSKSFWFGLSKDNQSKRRLYEGITRVMYEFGVSPLEAYGGEFRITGTIGSEPVNLSLSYSGMDSLVFQDLVGFLKRKDEADKKSSKKRK